MGSLPLCSLGIRASQEVNEVSSHRVPGQPAEPSAPSPPRPPGTPHATGWGAAGFPAALARLAGRRRERRRPRLPGAGPGHGPASRLFVLTARVHFGPRSLGGVLCISAAFGAALYASESVRKAGVFQSPVFARHWFVGYLQGKS